MKMEKSEYEWLFNELRDMEKEIDSLNLLGESKCDLKLLITVLITLENYLRNTNQTWNYHKMKSDLLGNLKNAKHTN